MYCHPVLIYVMFIKCVSSKLPATSHIHNSNEHLETTLNVNNSQVTPLVSEIFVVCNVYKSLEFIYAVLYKMMMKYNIYQWNIWQVYFNGLIMNVPETDSTVQVLKADSSFSHLTYLYPTCKICSPTSSTQHTSKYVNLPAFSKCTL